MFSLHWRETECLTSQGDSFTSTSNILIIFCTHPHTLPQLPPTTLAFPCHLGIFSSCRRNCTDPSISWSLQITALHSHTEVCFQEVRTRRWFGTRSGKPSVGKLNLAVCERQRGHSGNQACNRTPCQFLKKKLSWRSCKSIQGNTDMAEAAAYS